MSKPPSRFLAECPAWVRGRTIHRRAFEDASGRPDRIAVRKARAATERATAVPDGWVGRREAARVLGMTQGGFAAARFAGRIVLTPVKVGKHTFYDAAVRELAAKRSHKEP